MKANVPKAPREWDELSQRSRDKIIEWQKAIALQAAEDQLNRDLKGVLMRYVKMWCIIMHDADGYGERKLTRLIWAHKRTFFKQRQLVLNGSQDEYLDGRMKEIFKKEGFPQAFFDELLGADDEDGEIH